MITIEQFDTICEKTEHMPPASEVLGRYYPDVQTLFDHQVDLNEEKFAPFLFWLLETGIPSSSNSYLEFKDFCSDLLKIA